MKKIMICALCTLCGWTSAAANDTLTVRIEGMHCDHCAHKVKTLLKKDAGIGTVTFNLERRTATITYNPANTCPDSIYAHLEATNRYKAAPYSKDEFIMRDCSLRMDDMHCKKCSDRIMGQLSKMEGIDSMAPHLDKHNLFIRYDANRTCRDSIRSVINKIGYTPVNYYASDKVDYVYYLIPGEQVTQETIDNIIALDAVEDVNVNPMRNSLAISFLCDKQSADQLLAEIQKLGIQAKLPAPHECKEGEKK